MSASATAIQGFGLLIAQGLANAQECLDAMMAAEPAADGATRAATALALAGLAASLALRGRVWAAARLGASQARLVASAHDPDGLLGPVESEEIARDVVSWMLRRRGARHGR